VSYGLATCFEGKLMDARTRRHYCDLILSRGGKALPQDMVKDFLGREPGPDSVFKNYRAALMQSGGGRRGPAGCDNA